MEKNSIDDLMKALDAYESFKNLLDPEKLKYFTKLYLSADPEYRAIDVQENEDVSIFVIIDKKFPVRNWQDCSNNKVNWVGEYRKHTGCSLKEAVAAVKEEFAYRFSYFQW